MASLEIGDLMTSLSLGKYTKALRKHGWDDVAHLLSLDFAGLRKVAVSAKMKEGHADKFIHALLKLGDSSDAGSPRSIDAALTSSRDFPAPSPAPADEPRPSPAPADEPARPTQTFSTILVKDTPDTPLGLLLAGSRGWFGGGDGDGTSRAADGASVEGDGAEATSYLTVCELAADGLAAAHGRLHLGDLISTINGEAVTTLSQAAALLKAASDAVVLGVTRIVEEALLAQVLGEVSAISLMRASRQQSDLCAREEQLLSEAMQRSASEHLEHLEATECAKIREEAIVLSTLEASMRTAGKAVAAGAAAASGPSCSHEAPPPLTPRSRRASSSALLAPLDASASSSAAAAANRQSSADSSVYEAQLNFLLVHEAGAAGEFV